MSPTSPPPTPIINLTSPSLTKLERDKRDLKVMLNNGLSPTEAAEELQLSLVRVYQILESTTILQDLKATRDRSIIADYQAQSPAHPPSGYHPLYTMTGICARHDICRATLYRILRKHNIPLRRQPRRSITSDEITLITGLYQAGETGAAIRKTTGRSTSYIYSILHRSGVTLRSE